MSDLARTQSLRPILSIGAVIIMTAASAGAFAQSAVPDNPRAGQKFRECRNCPEMVVLPAGSDRMG